jgi:hypothetical protein
VKFVPASETVEDNCSTLWVHDGDLLDWLARNAVAGKRGSTPAEAPAIFERLGIDGVACSKVVKDFGRVFKNVAGKSTSIERAV